MALSPDEYSRLLQFLGQASAYSHHPKEVEHVQTHISHVFIAESLVYKIKKRVNLGFLDYSTLKKREHYCHREVELNRRLCDDSYLGVVPITREGDSFALKGHGEAVEFAVEMKKLQEEFFLNSYIENNSLTRKHLDRIADTLADFYREQNPGPEILQYGEIEKIKINTDENFDQTEEFIGETLDQLTFDTIRQYTNQYYRKKEQLFRRRIKQKRIVDGHGDLHLDHIHITPEKVRIYDCIEFNERFRYGDLAADLAYLAMDLDFVGRRKEERYFVAQMSTRMEDPDLHRVLDFYKCYRAYVKGKVKSIQSMEQEVDKADRKEAAQKAARYFDLSLRYALLGSEPVALIFMGRIGTGKSTLANKLSEKFENRIFFFRSYSQNAGGSAAQTANTCRAS
ncbi:MAG: hypothetical protein U5K69_08175 [Balneolaceae bacterium]|nr:hypothetical protein [Balneolaceae bacterium]